VVAGSSILGAVLANVVHYCVVSVMSKRREITFSKKTRIFYHVFTFTAIIPLGYLYIPKGVTVEILLQYILLCAMSVFALADAEHHFISNQLLLVLLMIWAGIMGIMIILQTQYGLVLLFGSLVGTIVGGLIFLLCYFLSRGQLGAGDVKLVFVMGLYLTGDRIMGAIFYGVLLCCAYSIVQLMRKKIGVKEGVPLAPFLYAGQLITYFIMA